MSAIYTSKIKSTSGSIPANESNVLNCMLLRFL